MHIAIHSTIFTFEWQVVLQKVTSRGYCPKCAIFVFEIDIFIFQVKTLKANAFCTLAKYFCTLYFLLVWNVSWLVSYSNKLYVLMWYKMPVLFFSEFIHMNNMKCLDRTKDLIIDFMWKITVHAVVCFSYESYLL